MPTSSKFASESPAGTLQALQHLPSKSANGADVHGIIAQGIVHSVSARSRWISKYPACHALAVRGPLLSVKWPRPKRRDFSPQ